MGRRNQSPALDTAQALERVGADLRGRHPERALACLLSVWAEHRAPEIASLIEALSAQLSGAYPALPTGSRRDFDEAWTTRLRAGDLAERGLLLERVLEGAGPEVCPRLQQLAALPPDPRIASAILRGVLHWTASPRSKTWTAMHRVLRAHADPRSLPALEHDRGPRDLYPPYGFSRRTGGTRRTITTIQRAIAKRAIALSPEQAATVAALAKVISEGVADQGVTLLANVYANPADLDQRRIYADWLEQRGDPRGEFINLQLLAAEHSSPAIHRRIAKLRSAHQTAWLGRIASAFVSRSVRFANGFPVHGVLRRRLRNPGVYIDAPEWATFQSLVAAPAVILRSSTMRSLTEIHDEERNAASLRQAEPPIPGVRRLVVTDSDRWAARRRLSIQRFDRHGNPINSDVQGLPDLREVAMNRVGSEPHSGGGFESWARRLASPLLQDLEQLELVLPEDTQGPLQVAGWLAMLRASRCRSISRLRLRRGDLIVDIEAEHGDWSRVHAHGRGHTRELIAHELTGLDNCELLIDE
ncbi:hypothetical protein DB30_05444 [Enhygromyxa salina]|uniref:Uncharacterized protein n=1 Tax=Enhygromyxa salina TaxID=215803 RepID=A0A0C2D163_9BACT|nr:TIGR02996 domain-containing protein [Enhygromyxa salina]KIG15570.1 hypothetical protein DB30_05444 [Enhygromyxa salina]